MRTSLRRRTYAWVSIVFLVLGALLTGTSKPAYGLNHVKALRTGKLVVAVPSPAIFTVPPDLRTAILPVLLGRPNSPGELDTYTVAKGKLQPAADNDLFGTRILQLVTPSLSRDTLATAQAAVPLIKWIRQSAQVNTYRDGSPLDTKKMQALAFGNDTDATVFVQPIVVFSSDLERAYVIATVTVYAWGPVQAFYMGSKNVYAETSLNDTRPALKAYGVENLAASDSVDKAVSEARARVWFADDAARLKQALAANMKKIGKQLVAYLNGD